METPLRRCGAGVGEECRWWWLGRGRGAEDELVVVVVECRVHIIFAVVFHLLRLLYY